MKNRLFALALALVMALTLAACGGSGSGSGGSSAAKSADLSKFFEDTVSGSGEEWPMMMELDADMQEAFYPGLAEIACKQKIVQMAAMSATGCELTLVEVENAGDVQKVQDIFQARVDYQVGDDQNPGGAWYPETIELWEKNSRIVTNGNSVMLVVCEDPDAVAESFNALFA